MDAAATDATTATTTNVDDATTTDVASPTYRV